MHDVIEMKISEREVIYGAHGPQQTAADPGHFKYMPVYGSLAKYRSGLSQTPRPTSILNCTTANRLIYNGVVPFEYEVGLAFELTFLIYRR